MLQKLRVSGASDGRATWLAPKRVSKGDAIEARFLQSLREGASDFEESQSAELWSELEQQCRSDLSMDEETIRFLIDGVAKYQRTRKALAKVAKTWRSRLEKCPKISWRPRVALLLCEGQAIRTFLHTDVCKKLAAWAELFVLSPYDIENEVAALGPHATFLPIPMIRRNRFDYVVGYLGYLQTESPTSLRFAQRLDENLQRALKAGEPIGTSLRTWQIGTAYQSPEDYLRLYCWSLKLFAHSYCLKEVMALLKTLDLDLMFNTSLVNWSSRLWTRAAALNSTQIVSNVISWDNMSTKTLIDEFVGMFLIWSNEMDEDFTTSLSFVRKRRRVVVGSPQFEPIVQGKGLVSRQEFLGQHGLDPNKKLILYTTGSKTLFPREADCLDRLLGHWRENLSDRANIMIRMHPKDRQGRHQEVMAKYPEVPFTVAGHLLTDEEWVPTRQDIGLMVNQLHHCDVIVNVASTMTLEGFAIDKPSINIGFNLGLTVSARYPMDDYYKSRHYRDIVDTGAAKLVEDYDQLFMAIDDVLDRKAYDVKKQRKVLHMKCAYTRDSSRRIDLAIRRYIRWNTSWARRRLSQFVSGVRYRSHFVRGNP